jgi:Domain of unknown function (DUF4747)
MAEPNHIEIGFLNIVASPHPVGVYATALANAANRPIRYRGRDYAVILPPRASRPDKDILEGAISLWTDIDASEPSIDKSTFEKMDVEAALKKVFAERGFNNRTFYYAFDITTHTMAIELRNELGKTISIRQAAKVVDAAFSSLNREGQSFDVTVRPDEDALETVLGFSRLDRVVILLKRPNPGDHHGDDAEEVLRELHEQNMKQARYEFYRQPGTDGIHLNDQNQVLAEVASTNGFVEGYGLDDEQTRKKRSTVEYPFVVKRDVSGISTHSNAVREEVKRFRAQQ